MKSVNYASRPYTVHFITLEKEKGVFAGVISLPSYFIKKPNGRGSRWEKVAPDVIAGDTCVKNGIIKEWLTYFTLFSPLSITESGELG